MITYVWIDAQCVRCWQAAEMSGSVLGRTWRCRLLYRVTHVVSSGRDNCWVESMYRWLRQEAVVISLFCSSSVAMMQYEFT